MRRRGATALSAGGESGRVALFATALLALATVATAWSGYQASRWSAEATKATMRGTAARLESTRASDLANAQAQIDVAVFTQWADAYATGEKQLRDFYFERFRPEFKPAVVAWIATRPLKNPNAPLTPFAMPQYTSKAREDAARLETEAERGRPGAAKRPALDQLRARRGAVRDRALLRRDEHEAAVPAARVALLTIGIVVFVCTLVWIALSPVASPSEPVHPPVVVRVVPGARRAAFTWAGAGRSRTVPSREVSA